MHSLNKDSLLVRLLIFHFEILGKDDKDTHSQNK